jgi:hypothetical protein
MNQPLARVAAHLLEPEAPDSMVSWGYLDAISRAGRVRRILRDREDDPRDDGRASGTAGPELEERKAADPEFAADPWAIRYWVLRARPPITISGWACTRLVCLMMLNHSRS